MITLSFRTLALLLLVPISAQAQFWEMEKPASFPPWRTQHAMAFDGNSGTTIMFGGTGNAAFLADTWQWDGMAWKQLSPATSPTARHSATMAFDTTRGQLVLWGGKDSAGKSRETWLWDGKTWTLAKPNLSPPAGDDATMADHPVRKTVILVVNDKGNQTWEWDGKEWAQLKPTASAPPLSSQQISYDPVRKGILLHGDFDLAPETWEWDGKTWTQLKPLVTPPKMSGTGMISDGQRSVVHLFGMVTSSSKMESWEWDGKDWAKVQTTGTPGKRWAGEMTWDGKRSRIVLFSGSTLDHETWELPLNAQKITAIGAGCQGSNNKTPILKGYGDPRPGGIVYWKVENAIPLMPMAFVFGFDQVNLDLKVFGAPGCVLLANTHSLIPGRADLNGIWRTIGVTVPMNPAIVGGKFWSQVLVYDPKVNRLGLTITNALETTVGY